VKARRRSGRGNAEEQNAVVDVRGSALIVASYSRARAGFWVANDWFRLLSYRGRWDFGYVLGGRAIQDVLYCEGVEHGTTIRIPGDGAWDVVWISPPQRSVTHLSARPEGDRIVITGIKGDRHLRWTFNPCGPKCA
jgi:hypothetical protein